MRQIPKFERGKLRKINGEIENRNLYYPSGYLQTGLSTHATPITRKALGARATQKNYSNVDTPLPFTVPKMGVAMGGAKRRKK